MADSINRIVPVPVSIDRAPQLDRERQKKPGEEKRKPFPGAAEGPASAGEKEEQGEELPAGEPDKGKNIDISA